MSQFELAEIMDVSQQTISKWENGVRKPDNDTLIKLAKIFNCTTDYLLGLTNERTKKVNESSSNNKTKSKSLEEYIKEAESLMLFGEAINEQDKEAILTALKIAYETAIKKNKEQNKYNK